jgi:ATP-dependent protease ClpP protease subunit
MNSKLWREDMGIGDNVDNKKENKEVSMGIEVSENKDVNVDKEVSEDKEVGKDNQNRKNNENGKDNDKGKGERGDKDEHVKNMDRRIEETGQVELSDNGLHHNIHMISIIGEIEGHENLSGNSKTTKYEHILPQLAAIEDSQEIDGLLVLLNTVGGDVEAGLAIAEMIASLSKPSVSLVLGGSHSIGVPVAVSTDYSFIVPTGTMVIHPVRMNGTVIGAPQTYDYFKSIQDRITGFVCSHCNIGREKFEKLMMETGVLTKDVGTILVGEETVKMGIIDETGGIDKAVKKLHELIGDKIELK